MELIIGVKVATKCLCLNKGKNMLKICSLSLIRAEECQAQKSHSQNRQISPYTSLQKIQNTFETEVGERIQAK